MYKRIEPGWLSRLVGLELWNRKYDGYAPNPAAAQILSEYSQLVPFVSLDFHRYRQFHPLTMVIELDGVTSEAAISDALRAGHAYPAAFGVDARRLTEGSAGPAIQGLERVRRTVARSARRAKSRAKARARER